MDRTIRVCHSKKHRTEIDMTRDTKSKQKKPNTHHMSSSNVITGESATAERNIRAEEDTAAHLAPGR